MADETTLNLNTTGSAGMSPEMEAVLNRYVLEQNKTNRKYTQFAQTVDIPQGKTKTIVFDKRSPLPKALQPLTEGVTPTGSAVNITRIKGEPQQFGNYVSYTDQLDFFAQKLSPDLLKYAELLTENQLETYEYLDAMELASGLNVFYAGTASSRSELTDVLTVKDVRRAVTSLKRNKVQPADGKYFVCFIHPDVAFNIMDDESWMRVQEYSATTEIYEGEIGKLYGVRFIEDPDAYVFRGTPFGKKGEFPELTIAKIQTSQNKIYVAETITDEGLPAAASTILIDNKYYTVASTAGGSNGSAWISVSESLADAMVEPDMKIYPGDGAVDGKPVYATILVGKNAYGSSGDKSVQIINKPIGSAGTADPLDQRGTVGWKGYRFFKILEQTKMCRIESLATVV
ncbi:MAG: N4-gp56 family major capsid protein [Candidatus Ornithomonoglobus sp.]